MAARDDSVIRGSLIACLIFLVLSAALNFFFWQSANVQAIKADKAADQLQSRTSELKLKDDQARLMKSMLGVGSMTEAELELLKQSASGDPEMQLIEQQFVRDMALLSGEGAENPSYPKVPEFLMNTIRSRNEQYGLLLKEVEQIKAQAESDIQIAQKAQQVAEQRADDVQKKLDQERQLFTQDRERINKEKEDTRDSLTKTVQEFTRFRQVTNEEKTKLNRQLDQRQNTIETQKMELVRLRSDQFETVQGNIRFVRGETVTINLGSADALRPGVTFGVVGGDETRLKDAKVKATIQVTRILADHLAEARVVARPDIRHPIIPGDFIYSPFWAPGRKVKIALAGDIDIDNDDRPDNEAIKGMITAAGATVVAEISSTGVVEGTLDASVRFLVVDEKAMSGSDDEVNQEQEIAIGKIKQLARELGVSVIPAWKLQAYLKTIDDTLTTPLGSAVRGEDFPPESGVGATQRYPSNLPELFRRQTEGMQTDNKILPP
ncbi:hypothetical protein [Novipirellula rosea]|uniref:Chromosome partition protein Smc n=1 Tax=Novipirellula rosea TaxID=1031540 RepID=A0ABP8NG41_9BACT|tara:strand:- start:213 stop:1691 length:1479 start_codon:yes stop_codon:yes gene_type:complete